MNLEAATTPHGASAAQTAGANVITSANARVQSTDYNSRGFRVCQALFPQTQAWNAFKRSLKAEFEESLFDHLARDLSAPFEAGDHKTIAVKVIDERGNELMVVHPLGK